MNNKRRLEIENKWQELSEKKIVNNGMPLCWFTQKNAKEIKKPMEHLYASMPEAYICDIFDGLHSDEFSYLTRALTLNMLLDDYQGVELEGSF